MDKITRDAVKTLKSEFQNYEFYKSQREENSTLLGEWICKSDKSNSEKYKKACQYHITVARFQIERYSRQLNFLDDVLKHVTTNERAVLTKLYIDNCCKSKLLKSLNMFDEGDLWLYIDDILTRIVERLEEQYADR